MAEFKRVPTEVIIELLPPGHAVTRDYMVTLVYRSLFEFVFTDTHRPLAVVEAARRKRHVHKIIDQMVRSRQLTELPDGRIRRNSREDQQVKETFSFGGTTHTCFRHEKDALLAELRNRTPEAVQRARIEAMEQTIAELKEQVTQ